MSTDGSLIPRLPCACASLRRASRAVTQLYERHLRDSGLRITQFTLLQALALAGELTQGALGDALAIDSTTLSRTLRPLELAGWVRSRPGEDDRRERHWKLTAAGRRKLDAAIPAWRAAQLELRKRVGDAGWQVLVGELTETVVALRHA